MPKDNFVINWDTLPSPAESIGVVIDVPGCQVFLVSSRRHAAQIAIDLLEAALDPNCKRVTLALTSAEAGPSYA